MYRIFWRFINPNIAEHVRTIQRGKCLAIAYIVIISLCILYYKLIRMSGGNTHVSLTNFRIDSMNWRQSKENISHNFNSDGRSQIIRQPDLSINPQPDLRFGYPMIFHYLPHLNNSVDNLRPRRSSSTSRKNVWLVMGITTVLRSSGVDYLLPTVESLILNLQPGQYHRCVILICVTEINNESYYQQVLTNLKSKFSQHLESGLLEVIGSPKSFYPNLTMKAPLFGDTLKRAKWRRKQNLDYIYLMSYAQRKGQYYMQLEDDIIAKENYFTEIYNFVTNLKSQDWITIYFSKLGFIGKFFSSSGLVYILEFLLMFYQEKPCDWLLIHFIEMLTCDGYNRDIACDERVKVLRVKYKTPLFQHMGKYSSLEGKIQPIKEENFVEKHHSARSMHSSMHSSMHPSMNPPAKINATLDTYSGNLEGLYYGTDIYWGKNPKLGDIISIDFQKPMKIEKYAFFSGNSEHPGDKLFNVELQILTMEVAKYLRSFKRLEQFEEESKENQLIFNIQGETFILGKDGYLVVNKIDKTSGILRD